MEDHRPRRGLGFLPEAAVIRDRSGPVEEARIWHDADEFTAAGPSRPLHQYRRQGEDSWELWKDWHTNQSGHAGRKGPPAFVPASRQYDELGRGMAEGYGVDVEEGEEGKEPKPPSGVADWYRTLAIKAAAPANPPEPPDTPTVDVKPTPDPVPTSTTKVISKNPPDDKPATSSDTPAPTPVRVHRNEWFIRRALANSTSTSAPTSRSTTPLSIGSLLSLKPTSRPPPRPSYTIGPDNAGYARLAALGWGGGGLGKPETEGSSASASPARRSKSVEVGPVVDADGVVDLTGDTSESESEEEAPQGPGRVVPVATVLKLDRLGLGRVHAEKRVTHTHKEIMAAQKRKRGRTENRKKVNWKEKDKRERESRRRIAAALNA